MAEAVTIADGEGVTVGWLEGRYTGTARLPVTGCKLGRVLTCAEGIGLGLADRLGFGVGVGFTEGMGLGVALAVGDALTEAEETGSMPGCGEANNSLAIMIRCGLLGDADGTIDGRGKGTCGICSGSRAQAEAVSQKIAIKSIYAR